MPNDEVTQQAVSFFVQFPWREEGFFSLCHCFSQFLSKILERWDKPWTFRRFSFTTTVFFYSIYNNLLLNVLYCSLSSNVVNELRSLPDLCPQITLDKSSNQATSKYEIWDLQPPTGMSTEHVYLKNKHTNEWQIEASGIFVPVMLSNQTYP